MTERSTERIAWLNAKNVDVYCMLLEPKIATQEVETAFRERNSSYTSDYQIGFNLIGCCGSAIINKTNTI